MKNQGLVASDLAMLIKTKIEDKKVGIGMVKELNADGTPKNPETQKIIQKEQDFYNGLAEAIISYIKDNIKIQIIIAAGPEQLTGVAPGAPIVGMLSNTPITGSITIS